ncbi:unnamed protein product [Lactuca virosa]|uniref:Pectinesterase inhibitor domain-containing protein n=1 Tax=Lactuca virosa TaxID=75947 RepID=A0AAU9MKV4_9ASTR|nr:unnamed protein product [Lactuca virosa]
MFQGRIKEGIEFSSSLTKSFLSSKTNPIPRYNTNSSKQTLQFAYLVIALSSVVALLYLCHSLNQMEVKLWNDKREREMYENFAELYAIIKATEKLEKAYVRDIIPSSDYETECQKLIAHFKTLSSNLKDTVPSIERFHDTYKMDCPAAMNRLITSGVPATVEHRAAASASGGSSAAIVAECVANFITAMDTLKLNMVAVDQVFPLLSDLLGSLNKIQGNCSLTWILLIILSWLHCLLMGIEFIWC